MHSAEQPASGRDRGIGFYTATEWPEDKKGGSVGEVAVLVAIGALHASPHRPTGTYLCRERKLPPAQRSSGQKSSLSIANQATSAACWNCSSPPVHSHFCGSWRGPFSVSVTG